MRLNQRVSDYWLRYYTTPVKKGSVCSLCGNSGIIDTRGVKIRVGDEVGRLNFCICPNGQILRKSKKIPSQA